MAALVPPHHRDVVELRTQPRGDVVPVPVGEQPAVGQDDGRSLGGRRGTVDGDGQAGTVRGQEAGDLLTVRNRLGAQASSTITGTWSLGPLPLRSSRSMEAPVTRSARPGEQRAKSIRMPRRLGNDSCL